MRALTAIVPNPSLDRVEVVPALAFGQALRASQTLVWPGGSATHAALVARALGVASVTVIAPVGGTAGVQWAEDLRKRAISALTVDIAGSTRSNISVLDAKGLTQVEVIERGPTLDETEAGEFAKLALRAVTRDSVVILSGSFPVGLELPFVTKLAHRADLLGATLVCDLGGPALGLALEAGVDWAKANLEEARSCWLVSNPGLAVKARASNPVRVAHALSSWLQDIGPGAQDTNVVLTMGSDGALWRGTGGTYRLSAPRARVFNPIGSGDAMVGAMAAALCFDLDATQVARWGAAAAAENLAHPEPGTVNRLRFRRLLSAVVLEQLLDIQDAATDT